MLYEEFEKNGTTAYSRDVPQVFFSAAGYRNGYNGLAYNRGRYGDYWSSYTNGMYAYYLGFDSGSGSGHAAMYYLYRAFGFSVRCVQK